MSIFSKKLCLKTCWTFLIVKLAGIAQNFNLSHKIITTRTSHRLEKLIDYFTSTCLNQAIKLKLPGAPNDMCKCRVDTVSDDNTIRKSITCIYTMAKIRLLT